MKLMSFRTADGAASWGVVRDDHVIDLGGRAPSLGAALAMPALIDERAGGRSHALAEITYLPPIPNPQKILCVGLNYATHVREGGRELPARPVVFTRFANTQVGHLQPLVRPFVSETLDFEGELAVIIGKRCRHVPRAAAGGVIAGFACYNDGSVREWQRHSAQFTPGKNFVGTGGFGPWLVTPGEMGALDKASLVSRVNGVEMQRATLDDLIFDVPTLIEYCSTFTEFVPGDVIITGTTGGVGAYRTPPLWLKPGDTVEVEISGIGVLRNPVIQEPRPAG